MKIDFRIRALGFLLSASFTATAGTASPMTAGGPAIRVMPVSSYLSLNSTEGISTLREASTVIMVDIQEVPQAMHPIEVFACVAAEEALSSPKRMTPLHASSLRIRNDRGMWSPLQPLPDLGGCLGVRIGIITSNSMAIPLNIQLHLAPGQASGKYQGVLYLEIKEQQ